ncbi:MAG: hypothetical protein PHR35_22530, partial [Kiritimatiellae bacterium]|nr:hypothetical protein [Kiritimatiellia bacterium]
MKTPFAIFAVLGTLGPAWPSRATWIDNPDTNTLWVEDGRDIQVGPTTGTNHWNNAGLTVTP